MVVQGPVSGRDESLGSRKRHEPWAGDSTPRHYSFLFQAGSMPTETSVIYAIDSNAELRFFRVQEHAGSTPTLNK